MYVVYAYRPNIRGTGTWSVRGGAETLERADHLAACVYYTRSGKLVKARTRIEHYPELTDILLAPHTLVV